MYIERILGKAKLELLSPLKSQIAFSDFVVSAGTIEFTAYNRFLENKSLILFSITFPGYELEAKVNDGRVFIRRNDFYQHSDKFTGSEGCHVAIQWDTNSIGCGVISANEPIESMNKNLRAVQTPFTSPPLELVRTLREHSLLSNSAYKTADDFFVTLLDCIHLSQIDIKRHGCERFVWGKGGDKSRPIDEPEISRFVAGYLSSHGAARNFEVVCEPLAGSGNVDFYAIAPVANSGLSKIAIEAKKAENGNYAQGFQSQLPSYIHATSATHGIFLTYWLKSADYPFPSYNTYAELETEKLHPISRPDTIRTVSLDLSNGPTPSNTKV